MAPAIGSAAHIYSHAGAVAKALSVNTITAIVLVIIFSAITLGLWVYLSKKREEAMQDYDDSRRRETRVVPRPHERSYANGDVGQKPSPCLRRPRVIESNPNPARNRKGCRQILVGSLGCHGKKMSSLFCFPTPGSSSGGTSLMDRVVGLRSGHGCWNENFVTRCQARRICHTTVRPP